MNEQYPKIGQRWQYRNRFIMEITIENYHYNGRSGFRGIVIQGLEDGNYVGYLNGDSHENLNTWIYLQGQDKPNLEISQ